MSAEVNTIGGQVVVVRTESLDIVQVTTNSPVTKVNVNDSIPMPFPVPGPQGPPGDSAMLVENETPSGLVDGSNATFNSANDFVPASVEVFINGLKQKPIVHYITMGTQTIIFADSPQTGDQILINYQKA